MSAAELEVLAGQYWANGAYLLSILEELRYRSTPKAQRLERKVEERCRELTGIGGTNTAGRAGGGDSYDLSQRAVRAEQRVRELETDLQHLRAELDRVKGSAIDPTTELYAQVGLHPMCPEFVLRVTQRAFRKEYHPDALSDRPVGEQKLAEEKFKEIDNVFVHIQKHRKSLNL
jgi:hypothetical protein